MGRRDYRKVTQRKPKTKGKGDELIDWTIKDLDRRGKNLQQQLELYSKQLLHGMDGIPSETSQPKRRGNVKQPSQEERWRKEEEDFAKQQAEWNEANEAQVNPIPPELTTPNPDLQGGIMFPGGRPTDQDLRLNEVQIEYAQKKAKLDFEEKETINNLRTLFLNTDKTYNRSLNNVSADEAGKLYSIPSNKAEATGNDTTDNSAVALNKQVAEQEVSDSYEEPTYLQSKEDAKLGRTEDEAKESFLTKSNNAAVKSGAWKGREDELWKLQQQHRSRSEVKTGSEAGANIAKENLQKQ